MANEKKICRYDKILEPFSDSEIKLICQLKRFFEWATGDMEFAASVDKGKFSPEQLARLKKIGVTFDPKELSLLWKEPEACVGLFAEIGCYRDQGSASDDEVQFEDFPLLNLWWRYLKHKTSLWRESRGQAIRVPQNTHFDAWRLRRIAAVRSELGLFGYLLDHPILAFELGDGCSMGCWFCGFAARKLKRNFDYTQNKAFFISVVQHCIELFGREQAAAALLYYGTEPHDNPNYIDMLKRYAEMTGHALCTSTAVVTDTKWMRDLIAYYRKGSYPWPRLSVLTTGLLRKIHELYTPEELRDIELLQQMKEHSRPKVTGGRILEEHAGMRERQQGHYLDEIIPQGSIACVSGFLINLVNRTIQVISPCYTCSQWPHGYRVFTERKFEGSDDFRVKMEEIIERHMRPAPFAEMLMRFRDDLEYRPQTNGFDLVSSHQIHHFNGAQVYAPLGRVIASGDKTFEGTIDAMMNIHKVNPMLALAACHKIFHGGFLDEVDLYVEDTALKEAV